MVSRFVAAGAIAKEQAQIAGAARRVAGSDPAPAERTGRRSASGSGPLLRRSGKLERCSPNAASQCQRDGGDRAGDCLRASCSARGVLGRRRPLRIAGARSTRFSRNGTTRTRRDARSVSSATDGSFTSAVTAGTPATVSSVPSVASRDKLRAMRTKSSLIAVALLLMAAAVGAIRSQEPHPASRTAHPGSEETNWQDLRWRNVGPTRGGRVTAIAGVRSQPCTFYMGGTGGGVWKTRTAVSRGRQSAMDRSTPVQSGRSMSPKRTRTSSTSALAARRFAAT